MATEQLSILYFVEQIKKIFNSDEILFASIAGSRRYKLTTASSDYDIFCILKNFKGCLLLGNNDDHFFIQGQESFERALSYANGVTSSPSNTNDFMLDLKNKNNENITYYINPLYKDKLNELINTYSVEKTYINWIKSNLDEFELNYKLQVDAKRNYQLVRTYYQVLNKELTGKLSLEFTPEQRELLINMKDTTNHELYHDIFRKAYEYLFNFVNNDMLN